MMGNQLKHFKTDEILLSDQEVVATLNFFYPQEAFTVEVLKPEMRSFAQAMLVEAVDRSYEMGYVEILFDTFMYRPVVDFVKLKSMVQSFLKKAAKHWFTHYTGGSEDPKIYETVKLVLTRNQRIVIDEYKNGTAFSY